jgi:hypothetical protein
MFMRVVALLHFEKGVWGMLSEKELVERGFRALEELLSKSRRPVEKEQEKQEYASEKCISAEATLETKPGPVLAPAPEPLPAAHSLKGTAVELWCDHAGGRMFIVADEADAQEAMKRFGTHRGEVWIPAELELVGRIEDQAIRDEIADFKRQIGGRLSRGDAGEAVSAAEQRASMLNELFRTQGVTGQPGRITAATVRDGERKAREKEL